MIARITSDYAFTVPRPLTADELLMIRAILLAAPAAHRGHLVVVFLREITTCA